MSGEQGKFGCDFYLGDNVIRQIKVAKIDTDGDCLYAALAHQLFQLKLSSRKHKRKTQDLRAETVNYLRTNVLLFKHELKNRLQDCKVFKTEYSESDFIPFINYKLSCNGFWGGAESLKAISHLYAVNIIVFLEDGPCYVVNNFNFDYKRSVTIAYRNSEGYLQNADANFNHYDSVCTIDQNDLIKCMEKIVDSNRKQTDMHDTIISLNETA